MNLTAQQIATLKAVIAADPTAAALAAVADDVGIANWLNTATTFVVWRTQVGKDELRQAVLQGASDLDNLSQGKRDALLWVCGDVINPAYAGVHQALGDLTIKSGGAGSTLLRTPLDAVIRRAATRLEKALATGTGTTATPGFLTVEGLASYADASVIRS